MKMPPAAAAVLVLVLFAAFGCSRKQPEVSELQRKEAAHLFSEAEFAITLRDWARAESVLSRVVQLAPDTGVYWINLGVARMRLDHRNGAREAYQKALRVFEAEAAREARDPDPWLQQIHLLALLGRADDARKLQEKMAKRFPNDRNVLSFIQGRQLDAMLGDPAFKEMAL